MSQLTRRTFALGSLALSGIIQNIRSPVLIQTASPAASGPWSLGTPRACVNLHIGLTKVRPWRTWCRGTRHSLM